MTGFSVLNSTLVQSSKVASVTNVMKYMVEVSTSCSVNKCKCFYILSLFQRRKYCLKPQLSRHAFVTKINPQRENVKLLLQHTKSCKCIQTLQPFEFLLLVSMSLYYKVIGLVKTSRRIEYVLLSVL